MYLYVNDLKILSENIDDFAKPLKLSMKKFKNELISKSNNCVLGFKVSETGNSNNLHNKL